MSSVTTAKVDTINGTTDLTVTTGNTAGPKIVVRTNEDGGIVLGPNSIVNSVFINATGLSVTANVTLAANISLTADAVSTANITANVVTSNVAVVSSNTLTLGTSSIANPGHSRLPNGLLMQWGNVSVNSTVGTITFPTAFNALYSITVSPTTNATSHMPAVIAVTTTSASIRSANVTSNTVYWMAIGS